MTENTAAPLLYFAVAISENNCLRDLQNRIKESLSFPIKGLLALFMLFSLFVDLFVHLFFYLFS